MGMLAPLFLLGVALIALPIWLHRLQTETPDRKKFASSMFLTATDQPVHVQRKLRHWVILAMRILFLILLALTFSQPFWPRSTVSDAMEYSVMHLILIDSSASMAANGGIDEARDLASGVIEAIEVDEVAQILSIDESLHQHTSVSADKSELRAAVSQVQPSELPLDFGFVGRSLEALMSVDGLNYQIHFISDFQQSAMPTRFADLIPEPKSNSTYTFIPYPLGDENRQQPVNFAIDQVSQDGASLRVSIRAYGDINQGQLPGEQVEYDLDVRLRVNDGEWRSKAVNISATGRQVVSFDGLLYEPMQNRVKIELLVDDSLSADNHFYQVVDRSASEPLLLLTENPYGPSALYLSAVFPEQLQQGQQRNYVADIQSISEFDPRIMERYSWVLIDDIGALNASTVAALTEYLRSGGSALAVAGERALMLGKLPISDLPLLGATLSNPNNRFAKVANLDSSHPLLNQLTGWNELRFENWVRTGEADNTNTLVQLEGGDALLLETRIGRGRLLTLTSSLDNQWNNLPVKPVFVAFMRATAEYLSGAEIFESQAYAGDGLRMQGMDGSAGQLVDPNGESVLALGSRLQSGQLKLLQTGFYTAHTAAGEYLIGSNLNPYESELVRLTDEAIENWANLASMDQATGTTENTVLNTEEEGQQPLWQWLLILAVIVLVAESVLANLKLLNSKRVLRQDKSAAGSL